MTHLDDADLIRVLDGAAEDPHVAECAACARRRALLARRGERLASLLEAADGARRVLTLAAGRRPPAAGQSHRSLPRWSPARLAAAAVVTLIAAGGVVPPVRAWVADRATALWHAVRGREAPAAPAAAPTGRAGSSASSVAFVPEPGFFTLHVITRQAEGELVIEPAADSIATASVESGAGTGEWVVLPDGLRLMNAADASHGYRVRLPGGVTRIVVRIGTDPARLIAPADLPVVVSLQRPVPR